MKNSRLLSSMTLIGIHAMMAMALLSARAEASPLIYLRGVPAHVTETSGFDSVQHEFTAEIVLAGVSRLKGMSITFMYDSSVMEAVDENGQTADSLTIYPGLFDTEISNEVEDTRSVVIGDEADTTLQGIIRLTGLSTGSAVDVSGEQVIRRTK